jgi:hypothetical protein
MRAPPSHLLGAPADEREAAAAQHPRDRLVNLATPHAITCHARGW